MRYVKRVCHQEPGTGLRGLPQHLSGQLCQVMDNWAHFQDAEHDLSPTTLAVLGPGAFVI